MVRREGALTFCCELIATVLLRRLEVRPKALWTCNGVLGFFTRMHTCMAWTEVGSWEAYISPAIERRVQLNGRLAFMRGKRNVNKIAVSGRASQKD